MRVLKFYTYVKKDILKEQKVFVRISIFISLCRNMTRLSLKNKMDTKRGVVLYNTAWFILDVYIYIYNNKIVILIN